MIIKLSGEEAKSFLHGQVTCDVMKLDDSPWLAGCHCNAKGKMWSTFILFQKNGELFLILTKESGKTTLAELNKYGVFAKTDIIDDSANWYIYGTDSEVEGQFSAKLANDHFLVVSNSELDINEDSTVWWQNEIESGRAHLFDATVGEYVPQMLNLQALDYISFQKGCYMGQEMVARMRYLGKNKRALFVAKSDSDVDLKVGQDVYIELNGNRRSAGKVIQSICNQGQTMTQLVLNKDTELTTTIYTSNEGSQTLNLLQLPYSLEEQN